MASAIPSLKMKGIVTSLLVCLLFDPSLRSEAFIFRQSFSLAHWKASNSRASIHLEAKNRNENEPRKVESSWQEEKTRQSLVEAILNLDSSISLVPVNLVGQAKLPTTNDKDFTCLVLTERPPSESSKDPARCLLLPLTNPNQLKLIEVAVSARPLSKTVLLVLNTLLVNRDEGLFDNCPWSTWTVDPEQRNRDAAGNPIEAKYHLGKRDAYNVLMGKDWRGRRSLALDNLAQRLQDSLGDSDDSTEESVLGRRLLELQVREFEMDVAEYDYQLAIARQNDSSQVKQLEQDKQSLLDNLQASRDRLNKLSGNDSDTVSQLLDDMANWNNDEKPLAPYRGATGYAPKRDDDNDAKPHTSPYDIFKKILEDQLKAEVIGCVVENTSLLEGTTTLGGALVLRRKTATKSVNIAGERLTVDEEEEDYGNLGVTGGETFLVECDADEAIGMSLACSIPLQVESNVWERASLMAQPEEAGSAANTSLPLWTTLDPELSFLVEGQAGNESVTERAAPVRVPRTTTSLFDSLFEPKPESAPADLFPADNPIKSLSEYDELSDEDKARTLMSISNFEGKLPRPRVLRQTNVDNDKPNALDKLLLPLIDESVRRQYQLRDAEKRGDMDLVRELKEARSKRQIAKEKAEEAREAGSNDVAEWWEGEAELYESLRADVTQDEGSYSRFLDRDDWYERERQMHAKKIDKKKFGTLLDGIE